MRLRTRASTHAFKHPYTGNAAAASDLVCRSVRAKNLGRRFGYSFCFFSLVAGEREEACEQVVGGGGFVLKIEGRGCSRPRKRWGFPPRNASVRDCVSALFRSNALEFQNAPF